MKFHRIAFASITFTSLLAMAAFVYAQGITPKRSARRAANIQSGPKAIEKADPNTPLREFKYEDFPRPPFDVHVRSSPKPEPDAKALYEQIANTFQTYEVIPPARLSYFSAMNNPPKYVIKGWGGTLTDVQPNEAGGYTVNLSVCPTVEVAGWGTPAFPHGYAEQYWIDADNNIHYLGSKDLDGRAGMKPMVMTIN